eukprot:CAMPEP_0117752522 /NCGR_PEP_ID=MMETSP0947-20121206/11655_1 /TAXON_ID=44440 /ORGANISM="Chattonella subsalsa, Strain CCMP2191" /LENGTH=271 /DNA_ID=CAMNT_0005571179 /DNA_START=203 /DNA_END=1018 /DNA_ORIENTATION=+
MNTVHNSSIRYFANFTRPAAHKAVVDEVEIKKFQNVKSDWWVPSSRKGTGPLHAMNPVRISFIKRQLELFYPDKLDTSSVRNPLKSLDILDVGCGGGILTESLSRLGATVTGIDPGVENIRAAKMHASLDPETSSISYKVTTSDDLANSGEQFDVVCSLEVIEHVPDPAQFVDTLCKLTKPKGSLFISTMNKTAKSYLITILGAEYITQQIPIGTHDWSKYIPPTQLSECFEKNGVEVVNISGLVYNPLCNTWRIDENDTDVNYIMHAKLR